MNQRIKMIKIRELIRLGELSHSQREISNILGLSRGTVQNYLGIIKKAKITYNDTISLGDDELSSRLEIEQTGNTKEKYQKLINKFSEYSRELNRTGVTLHLLWEEYKSENPDGYGYSQFCFHYQQWKEIGKVSMHLEHKYGDKMFVDFTGDKIKITNPTSGLENEFEVFVSVLGGSGLAYAEAVRSQKKEDFIKATENSILYFGGVPKAIVPDCLKSAVTIGDKYEPEINPDYADFARHYSTVILPARPYRPKDKSPVENGVNLVYQRIFAPLRNKLFTSMEDLNESIRVCLEEHNSRLMSRVKLSRRELFNRYEKEALKALPGSKYEFKRFATATVQINYHVYLKEDGHYYSVPHNLKGKRVNIIFNENMVEIYHKNLRIAIHERDRGKNKYSTNKDHMPSHHRFYAEWNPDKILSWSESIGESVKNVSSHILGTCAHPEQGFKSCVGIISLAKKFGSQRLIKACEIALSNNEYSYRFIHNILQRGMDKIESTEQELPFVYLVHENIRGNGYYSSLKENENDK